MKTLGLIQNNEEYLVLRRERNRLRDLFDKAPGRSGGLKSQIKNIDDSLEIYERQNPGIENKYEE